MPGVRKATSISGIGPEIKALRQSLGSGQVAFADAAGIQQSQLARYEGGKRDVPVDALLRMAELAPPELRSRWLGMVGVKAAPPKVKGGTVTIPLLADKAAAGRPLTIDDHNRAGELSLPSHWFVGTGELQGVPIEGDSMEPVIPDGSTVIVDLAKRSLHEFVNWIVVARLDGEVTVKLLQAKGSRYVLTPLNPTTDNIAYPLTASETHAIVGRVVRWISEPVRWKGLSN